MIRYVMLAIIVLSFVVAQVPQDYDTIIINKVDTEHKNTRKFLSDELSRQENEFFKEMDDRATYYENEVETILSQAVWKLGLIWAGVTFLIFSIIAILNNRLEKRRYKLFMKMMNIEEPKKLTRKEKKQAKKQSPKPEMTFEYQYG